MGNQNADQQSKSNVTVILLAKNEEGGIALLVTEILHAGYEVLVVDGHSSDETRSYASLAGARVVLDNGRGKGDGYRVGLQIAQGDIVVFMDSDGSHDPRDIPRLVAPIINDDADMVIGSRFRGGSDEWQGDVHTFLRSVGGWIITLVINYRWGVNLTECLNGYRAIRRTVGLSLDLKADDFDVEQHMVVRCLKNDYRLIEIATHEYMRKWGHSKLPTYRKAYLFFVRLVLDLLPW